jgi:hypothetical protein
MPDSPHSTAELRHARSKRAAEYYLANQEKIRARQRETYWRNLEKSRAYGRAKYQRRREKTRLLAPFRYELHCVDCSRTIFSPVSFKKRCDACRIALARKRHFIYNHSKAGRAAAKRFRQSEKGKQSRQRELERERANRLLMTEEEKAEERRYNTESKRQWREKNRERNRAVYNAWCRKNWHTILWPRKKFDRQLNRERTRSSKRRSWLRNRERRLFEQRLATILEKTILTAEKQREWRKLPTSERETYRRALLAKVREAGINTEAMMERLQNG